MTSHHPEDCGATDQARLTPGDQARLETQKARERQEAERGARQEAARLDLERQITERKVRIEGSIRKFREEASARIPHWTEEIQSAARDGRNRFDTKWTLEWYDHSGIDKYSMEKHFEEVLRELLTPLGFRVRQLWLWGTRADIIIQW